MSPCIFKPFVSHGNCMRATMPFAHKARARIGHLRTLSTFQLEAGKPGAASADDERRHAEGEQD